MLSRIAIAGAIYSFVAVAALHLLRPDYDPVSEPLSYYAVGPYGSVMTVVFFAFALSLLAVGLGLYRGIALSKSSQAGVILLIGAGVGWIATGVFPTDVTLNSIPDTLMGLVHTLLSYVASPSLVAAMLLLSRVFKMSGDGSWSHYLVHALALAGWASFVLLPIVDAARIPIGGIGQRLFLALTLLWLLLMATRLRSLAGEAPAT